MSKIRRLTWKEIAAWYEAEGSMPPRDLKKSSFRHGPLAILAQRARQIIDAVRRTLEERGYQSVGDTWHKTSRVWLLQISRKEEQRHFIRKILRYLWDPHKARELREYLRYLRLPRKRVGRRRIPFISRENNFAN